MSISMRKIIVHSLIVYISAYLTWLLTGTLSRKDTFCSFLHNEQLFRFSTNAWIRNSEYPPGVEPSTHAGELGLRFLREIALFRKPTTIYLNSLQNLPPNPTKYHIICEYLFFICRKILKLRNVSARQRDEIAHYL